MTEPPPLPDADLFDEAGYLRLYPTLAEAAMRGMIDTPWDHFDAHGRAEGRRANDVDPDFYLAAYPGIARDLGRPPSPADAAPHYFALGRARGWRPNAAAPRPPNGAAFGSPFGGFWTDQANAPDLIQGRLDLGRIDPRQAAMLRALALDGIAGLERPMDPASVEAAAQAVGGVFDGTMPESLFVLPGQDTDPQPWRPELIGQPAAVLDPHMLSRTIRDMVFDTAVTEVLSLLFESPPRLIASRASLRWTAPPERDSARIAVTLPLQFVAVIFALEGAGALEDAEADPDHIWPGSHRLPDLPWPGGHPSLPEARRGDTPGLDEARARRGDAVRHLLRRHAALPFAAAAGARAIRHANLFHASEALERPRRSVTAWYCPAYALPCYVETTGARTHERAGMPFSSGVYPELEPRE